MKKNCTLLLFLLLSFTKLSFSSTNSFFKTSEKDTTEKKWTLKFGGYLESAMFFDTRQTVSSRENMLLLYPEKIDKDSLGNDINDNPAFNELAVSARFNVSATCPNILNAKTTAFAEGDFVGQTNAHINGLRLRHAYIKMEWKNNELLFGQYWHPLTVADMFPTVNNPNGGAPYHPFSRNPQLRYVQKINHIKLIASLLSQRDFASSGHSGTSARYLINSAIPMLNFQFQYANDIIFTGFGGNYKVLKPRLRNGYNNKANETISSVAVTGFASLTFDKIQIKTQGVWGQDIADLLSLGGYAESQPDPITGNYTYTNSSTAAVWADINFKCNKWLQPGIFGGYIQNLGYEKEINNLHAFYGMGHDIKYLYRISPRIKAIYNKLTLCLEFDYSIAGYGKTITNKGIIKDLTSANNFRTTISAYYYF